MMEEVAHNNSHIDITRCDRWIGDIKPHCYDHTLRQCINMNKAITGHYKPYLLGIEHFQVCLLGSTWIYLDLL